MSPGHSPRSQKVHRRLCIVRTISGHDYHFRLSSSDDPTGYRLQRHSGGLRLIRNDGMDKMIFYTKTIDCVRFEEGLDDGALKPWSDPIM